MTTQSPPPRTPPPMLLVILLVVATIAGYNVLRGPGPIERISVTNPSDFDVLVEVREHDSDLWMGLGHAQPQSTEQFTEVADQGATWVFRFTAQGVIGGESRRSRASLKANGWRLTVPSQVIQFLRNNAPPPPPPGW